MGEMERRETSLWGQKEQERVKNDREVGGRQRVRKS